MKHPVRKTTRIPQFDYSTQNYYFITICSHEKQCIFHTDGRCNLLGKIAEVELEEISNHFPGMRVDKWVVMPNHVHMILIIDSQQKNTVPTVVGLYKSGVSRKIHELQPEVQVWQRSFHDHIIRNQRQYEKIWNYIEANPIRWSEDCFFCPQRGTVGEGLDHPAG